MAVASPPPNIDPVARLRNLSQLGSSVTIDNDIPPRRYLRSGLEMERMATVYLDEGNLEYAYILYTKLITLLVEKLPKHVHYKQVPAANKADSKKRVALAFQKAERLKATLKEKYKEDLKTWEIQEAERLRLEKEEEEKIRIRKEKELEEEKKRELDRQRELELKKQKEESERNNRTNLVSSSLIPPAIATSSINKSTPSGVIEPSAPPLQGYPEIQENTDHSLKTSEVRRTTPIVDRGIKPSWLDFVSGLRTVNVPTELIRKFVEIASPNTRQNRETCGILAGKLSQNVLHVTHLVIPKQTSTSDSCTTLNEEDIFLYQDTHDLITLGWIHTHPSQTAFMSSVDLHTHCSYQLMLPEAVAIVCAPKHSQTGMYSLTNEYGLKFIAACKQEGFHPHPKEPPIYEESGHVKLDGSSTIVVSDLR